ncbi:hypothetical protein T552_03374 [Pneumocystis carinii B80]|uniref:Uncharacterized protein n=1 Tax=Pneumocystis carinii (strain B80) TaxID=1408658 RepID=A0A0W4ZBX1_PNEC8|nr:hypothetical protein T552_03374 [Pneumocystis carinii B80]KTW25761.1 hypothetical protein T552_03374 [Pneumocystis carinii B80]
MYRRSSPGHNQPPNKRQRPESVLPADFFDSEEIQENTESNEVSPPPSPSYWARERLLDETLEQRVYDERAKNLIKRRNEIRNKSIQLDEELNTRKSAGKEGSFSSNCESESDSDASGGSRDWRRRGHPLEGVSREEGTHVEGCP